ncbi:MAG TPA: TIGR02281 family clan AA aspartic protease [Croceibacterium sp.]|nr:TIGR02281 family clan AA aspartic protease [Croceibacterium sp.]
MKHAPALIVIAGGGLFGWFAPDLSADSLAANALKAETPDTTATQTPDELQMQAWNGGDIILPRAADGHFYAEVIVGTASTRMLVDTGATMIALTGEDADAIGIPWRSVPMEPVARGVGGEVNGVRVVLDQVRLGSLEAHGLQAVVVPEGLAISLLGQSFLSRVSRVEIDRQKMVLGG